jgi:hypothetical protein
MKSSFHSLIPFFTTALSILVALSSQSFSTAVSRDSLNYFQSESELLYDWRFTANQFVLATSPLRPTTRIFISQLNTCGYSPYVTSSLMRVWVCLQLLLGLARAVILRSESRGTHDHILLSQIRDSPNQEGQVPYLYPPGTGWLDYTPRHWVSFSSPPTTRRATVEVFDPASIRELIWWPQLSSR